MERLFWAKLRGYPWWPAVVEDIDQHISDNQILGNNSEQVPIRFLGSHDYAIVSASKLKPFIENWSQFSSKGSSVKFKLALKEAQERVCIPLGIQKKKSRGRPSKQMKMLMDKTARFIDYCITKIRIVLGRTNLKHKEAVVCLRLLNALCNIEKDEIKAKNTKLSEPFLKSSIQKINEAVPSYPFKDEALKLIDEVFLN